jgi:hypothetical protein
MKTPPYCQHASEVSIRLECGDKTVSAQRDNTRSDPQPSTMFAHALPDEPRSAYLQ